MIILNVVEKRAPVFVNQDKYKMPQVVRAMEKLTIRYEGHPSPKVSWKLNDSGGLTNPPTTGTDGDASLTWLRADRCESTAILRYTVMLENEVGSTQMDIEVIVLGELRA